MKSSAFGEFELIRRYFSQGPGYVLRSDVILGVGDDAALIAVPPGNDLVAAVDTVVAGRHFLPNTDARSVGHRALAVNLSDMAAMGATPAWATLALTLPELDTDWLQAFSCGLMELAAAHSVALVGGDTTRGPLTVSVQILGYLPHGTGLRRSAAQAGDLLAVTGTLGDASAGLNYCVQPPSTADSHAVSELVHRFEFPTPRVQMGLAVRELASAAMDLSDGLAGDLPKLAQASGLRAQVAVDTLPLSYALRATTDLEQCREWALSGGDDYELLLAVSPARYPAVAAAAEQLNLTLTVIGELTLGAGVAYSLHGKDFAPRGHGYDHFG